MTSVPSFAQCVVLYCGFQCRQHPMVLSIQAAHPSAEDVRVHLAERKSQILAGTHLVFSHVIPSEQEMTAHHLWRLATSVSYCSHTLHSYCVAIEHYCMSTHGCLQTQRQGGLQAKQQIHLAKLPNSIVHQATNPKFFCQAQKRHLVPRLVSAYHILLWTITTT